MQMSVCGFALRLPKQRWAFSAVIMSVITVMDKGTESSCRVKYPKEKDHPRGAALNLLVSRGTSVSESFQEEVLGSCRLY
jgi:hypothetical protein